MFECFNDGKHFKVMDWVVAFCWQVGLRVVRNGMPLHIGVLLRENCSAGNDRSISFDAKGFVEVRKEKKRLGNEDSFECLKGFFLIIPPFKLDVLLCESMQGCSDLGEVTDKASIEVGKSKERLDLMDV